MVAAQCDRFAVLCRGSVMNSNQLTSAYSMSEYGSDPRMAADYELREIEEQEFSRTVAPSVGNSQSGFAADRCAIARLER